MPPTSGQLAGGKEQEIPTYINFNIRFATNNGIILDANGSNPERGYYNDTLVFTNLDDALTHIRNIAATPANT